MKSEENPEIILKHSIGKEIKKPRIDCGVFLWCIN